MFHKFETSLPGVLKIQPDVFGDARGFFMELYNQSAFAELGLGEVHFVQDNLSASSLGTIRGMHYQAPPHAQGKLVTVLEGKVLDVVVDIRRDSPAYGQHLAVELSAEAPSMLYIPEGFAHGFQVLSERCLFFYKCTGVYHKDSEGGFAWDDPDLGIPWKALSHIVSEKDRRLPPFRSLRSPF